MYLDGIKDVRTLNELSSSTDPRVRRAVYSKLGVIQRQMMEMKKHDEELWAKVGGVGKSKISVVKEKRGNK